MSHHQQALDLGDEEPEPQRIAPPAGYRLVACKYCSKRIFWSVLVDQFGDPVRKLRPDGRTWVDVRIPVNPQPDATGDLQLLPPGRVLTIAAGIVVMPEQRYRGHHDTCKRLPPGMKRRRARGHRR